MQDFLRTLRGEEIFIRDLIVEVKIVTYIQVPRRKIYYVHLLCILK